MTQSKANFSTEQQQGVRLEQAKKWLGSKEMETPHRDKYFQKKKFNIQEISKKELKGRAQCILYNKKCNLLCEFPASKLRRQTPVEASLLDKRGTLPCQQQEKHRIRTDKSHFLMFIIMRLKEVPSLQILFFGESQGNHNHWAGKMEGQKFWQSGNGLKTALLKQMNVCFSKTYSKISEQC